MSVAYYFVRPGEPYVYDEPSLTLINGSGAVLADDDLTTYVVAEATYGFRGVWAAALPAVPEDIIDRSGHPFLAVTASVSTIFEEGGTIPLYVHLGTDADGPNFTFGNDYLAPNNGDPTEFGDLVNGWGAVPEFRQSLIDGTAVIFFSSEPATPIESLRSATYYEFFIVFSYETPNEIPIRRLYPRPSGARIYPPPATHQSGGRFGSSSML